MPTALHAVVRQRGGSEERGQVAVCGGAAVLPETTWRLGGRWQTCPGSRRHPRMFLGRMATGARTGVMLPVIGALASAFDTANI